MYLLPIVIKQYTVLISRIFKCSNYVEYGCKMMNETPDKYNLITLRSADVHDVK